MEKSFHTYYRSGMLYLQPKVYATDLAGNWINISPLPWTPIIAIQPHPSDFADKISEVLSYTTKISFANKEEIERIGKENIRKLLKVAQVRSYKQLQKSASYASVSELDNKIQLSLLFPDEKNRGWVGRGDYEDRLFFDAPFNYEEIAEAMLKHLLNPANRYPEE